MQKRSQRQCDKYSERRTTDNVEGIVHADVDAGERDRGREDEQCRGEDERQRNPEQAEPSRVRETLEDRIQPARAVMDDPALEVAVSGDQAGTICFVCSTSARRSNGLPTKPCAPRSAASRPASSWPL